MPLILLMLIAVILLFPTMKNMISRANRNNNPGNLRYAGQSGATGADPNGFAIFSTIEMGWSALYTQINRDKARGLDLGEFISKYAPSTENNTANYLDFVSKQVNAGPQTPLSFIDTIDLASAISKMEGYIG